MKRSIFVVLIAAFALFVSVGLAETKDHVPKVEKVSSLDKVVVAEAAVIVPAFAIAAEVPKAPESAVMVTENRSETLITAESTPYHFRQRAGLNGPGSDKAITITGFIPRIRDKDL